MDKPTPTTGLAGEAGHWYDASGRPAYQVPAKNGELRNVTLRDARTLNLFPSVTTITRVAAAPGLEVWKRKQILLAAMTLPAVPGESVDDYARRVQADADAQGEAARALGTQIHADIEDAIRTGLTNPWTAPVLDWLHHNIPPRPWSPERSFSSPLGYGGKIDFHAPGVVIDFKTSDSVTDKSGGWDEQLLQLAAYARGLGEDLDTVTAGNLFVSTKEPGLLKWVPWTATDLHRGFAMFEKLLEYWQLQKGYVPVMP